MAVSFFLDCREVPEPVREGVPVERVGEPLLRVELPESVREGVSVEAVGEPLPLRAELAESVGEGVPVSETHVHLLVDRDPLVDGDTLVDGDPPLHEVEHGTETLLLGGKVSEAAAEGVAVETVRVAAEAALGLWEIMHVKERGERERSE